MYTHVCKDSINISIWVCTQSGYDHSKLKKPQRRLVAVEANWTHHFCTDLFFNEFLKNCTLLKFQIDTKPADLEIKKNCSFFGVSRPSFFFIQVVRSRSVTRPCGSGLRLETWSPSSGFGCGWLRWIRRVARSRPQPCPADPLKGELGGLGWRLVFENPRGRDRTTKIMLMFLLFFWMFGDQLSDFVSLCCFKACLFSEGLQ